MILKITFCCKNSLVIGAKEGTEKRECEESNTQKH